MAKTLDQIILDGQAAQCGSLEELFVLWELAHHTEAESGGCTGTCRPEINPRNFHVDGILDEERYSGVLYLLKEPSLRNYLARGGANNNLPVVTDLRPRILREGRRRESAFEYLAGMQRYLMGEQSEGLSDGEVLRTAALLYLNKRGGREISDDIWLNYANYYIEFLRREISLLHPRLIVCGGEEIFRLAVKEVFGNKKKIRGRGEHINWKDYVDGCRFYSDRNLRPARQPVPGGITVIGMWSPAYRVNGEHYLSREEYLTEFAGRAEGLSAVRQED